MVTQACVACPIHIATIRERILLVWFSVLTNATGARNNAGVGNGRKGFMYTAPPGLHSQQNLT